MAWTGVKDRWLTMPAENQAKPSDETYHMEVTPTSGLHFKRELLHRWDLIPTETKDDADPRKDVRP